MRYSLLFFVWFVISCTASKKATQPVIPEQVVNLEDVEVNASDSEQTETLNPEIPVYKPSYRREIDLLHTKLEVSFDWGKEEVIGKATLVLKPYMYEINRFRLDAKNFIIKSIKLNNTNLTYDYDSQNLYINLDKTYNSDQEMTIVIDYVARPSEFAAGSSAAITSEKGLFFIDANETDPDKPTQIWTQGETENNSRWFPTVDKPNERCTEEIYITVNKKYKTLSNGLLVSSKENADGTRTDYWKMDLPHAPYLFMMAIGEYSVINDQWKDVPLQYFVEPEFEKDAKQIYNHTPEILEFFSNTYGIKYPWPKLSQVVVRDYVSGAMENTSAIIYGEFIQKSEEELVKEPNDYILAHEIAHHWFGDYVTCESWSNLTLNEGFANYAEYLWFEHKYGKDQADMHRATELSGYLASAAYRIHPLIDFHYENHTDMFDAHSYNKGGLVLHMLRNLIGDKAFFKALKLYLVKNAFTPVEVHNLRMAFEEASGQDLNWFFDQWFLQAGHPILKISKSFDEATNQLSVTIQQTQQQDGVPQIFRFPIAIYTNDESGKRVLNERWVDQRIQTFTFALTTKPTLVEVDPDKIILCEREDEKDEASLLNLYNPASPAIFRYDAIDKIVQALDEGNEELRPVMNKAISDPLEEIRAAAVARCTPDNKEIREKIVSIAKNDPKEEVRIAAISFLGENENELFLKMADELLNNGTSAQKARVLLVLQQYAPQKALEYSDRYEQNAKPVMLSALAKIYADAGKTEKLDLIEKGLTQFKSYDLISYTGNYATLLAKSDALRAKAGFDKMFDTGMNSQSKIKRFAAAVAFFQVVVLDQMSKNEGEPTNFKIDIQYIKDKLKEIISNEKDPELQSAYERFRTE